MKQLTHPSALAMRSNWCESDKTEKESLNHNLFKPPKFDTNYFYYTEILSDWIAMKK